MSATQQHRQLAVGTALEEDLLLLYRVEGMERMGRIFEYTLDLLSMDHQIDFESLLGTNLSFRIDVESENATYTRLINGHIRQLSRIGYHGEYSHYRASVVPWLWFLTRTADCKIFQEMTVPDIILQVFRDHGFTDFENKLSGSYRQWEYCVQYRESAYDFVSRLMEQEGIYYYIIHDNGVHKVALADGASSHTASLVNAIAFYRPNEAQLARVDHIYKWVTTNEVQSTEYATDDFDFENPKADLSNKSLESRKHAENELPVYDYPGEYTKASDGLNYADYRLQEMQSRYHRVEGKSNCFGLQTGHLFAMEGHHDSRNEVEHLIIASHIRIQSNEYDSGDAPQEEPYCTFEAVRSSDQYRSARSTPTPKIRGPQTAIVVGPSGDEIWTDKYGRVKVQFHWDREGKNDENSSCWVRVAQSWAGKKWGTIYIPRIGQEVIVEFLEGDPDRPIITGRVYNADEMPPYDLPKNQTQSGIKTQSTAKGDAKTFNELRFEDKLGEEQIYFHAERDFERVVENNDTLKVGFEAKDVGDQTIEIFNNQKVTIGDSNAKDGSQAITVKNNYTRTVSEGDATIEIQKGNRSIVVAKGDDTLKIESGLQSTEAAKSITLTVGESSIKIEPAAITISSSKVVVDADMKVEIKGLNVEANGSAGLTLKGGTVKIN